MVSRWPHLKEDIFGMITKRLNLVEYLGMRAVCSGWRTTITKAIADKHRHPKVELPLLLLNSQNTSILPSRFFNISTESLQYLKRPLLERHQKCHGIIEGWLIISVHVHLDNKVVLFLNPVSNDVVLVPSLLSLPSKSPIFDRSNLRMGKMVASSNPKCSDCVLVGLFTDDCNIAFCRLSDKSWTMIEADKKMGNFTDVEIFDGDKFYVRTNINSVLVYDLQDSDDPPKPKEFCILPEIRPLGSRTSANQFQANVCGKVLCFLTKDHASSDLLVIYLFYDAFHEVEQYDNPPQITQGEVFKLDTSNETKKWVKLDRLSDRVLFLGHCTCFVMSREALNRAEELISENSIYFTLPDLSPVDPWADTQLGRLCLTDNSVKYFDMKNSRSRLKIDAEPFWFLPSAW